MADTQASQKPKTAPGFHHIALRASDFEATLRFYQDGLGFVRAYGWGEGDGRAAMLDTGDGNYLEVFAGGKAGAEAPEGALLHFALRTSDVDGAYARAMVAGARSRRRTSRLPAIPRCRSASPSSGGWTARSSSSSRTTRSERAGVRPHGLTPSFSSC